MKKTIFTLSLLTAAMIFAACGDSDNDDEIVPGTGTEPGVAGGYMEGSAIYTYYEPDSLIVYYCSPEVSVPARFLIWSIRTDVEYGILNKNWYSSSKEGLKYTNYYGDTTFSSFVFYHQRYDVSAMPLSSITITANKDFDKEHPAGTLLNDLFTLEYASAYNLIKSNYDPKINICTRGKFQTMPLSELKELILPHYIYNLYFNKLPETLGAYEFTIAFEYGKDPVSGREVQVPPVKVMAEFTDKDYVSLPKR